MNPAVIARVRDQLTAADLYASEKLSEAEGIAREIIEKGTTTVLTGGGDGTFTVTLSQLVQAAQERDAMAKLPRLGVLKLGTGNALAWLAGASELGQKGYTPRPLPSASRRIRLVEHKGMFSPFAGSGADAQVLADYHSIKAQLRDTAFSGFGEGLSGYLLAGLTRTLPRALFDTLPRVRIVNEGSPVYRVKDGQPDFENSIPKGALIYEGPARLCGVGSIPYYGFKMKMFPYAFSASDRVNLRITTLGPSEFLARLSELWRGELIADQKLFDFLIDKISIEFDHPTMAQIGGDAIGAQKKLAFAASDFEVELVDFLAQPTL
ncbi:MAG: hypothetical protein MK135_09220 [Polyangiaceae bacterium]|nr:hypothetical protein [Polyangiaceae bacterium]